MYVEDVSIQYEIMNFLSSFVCIRLYCFTVLILSYVSKFALDLFELDITA